MKPRKGQLEAFGGNTYKAGPYMGKIVGGELQITHISDPDHVITSMPSASEEAQGHLNKYHESVKGNIR